MNFVKDTVSVAQIQRIFEAQKAHQYRVGNSPVAERKAKLKALKTAVEVTYRKAIQEALKADFGKHPTEVDLSEIYPVTSEIKHTLANLSQWTAHQRVDTPLAFMGSSSYIKYEPKGVCLIISPWNFPVNLTFGPLVSAIAAGNTAIIKPSEYTPHISDLMAKIIKELFDENEVALVQGGIETSTMLLELPFNHIFFTGAPSIGKVVMVAAAKNLASVTLELGGKSPTIVDETANVKTAAKRIAWGKFLNSGQICIAPDYVLVHESKKEALVEEISKATKEFFGENPAQNDQYTRMVNPRHTARVVSYIQDSVLKGAQIRSGGKSDEAASYIQPTIVTDVPMDSALMENEIFGPVLPILSFKTLDEAIGIVQSKEKPLALYIYSSSDKNIAHIIQNTRAGGTCINFNDVHYFQHNLPFGGSNNSGIGKAHGFFGFQSFSNARAVYRQHIPAALEMLTPPYNDFKQKMIDLTIKWF
ncbi:MAG: aldehyde dehydrogenase family protein [Spirosomaceae bacterium]|nr:aldehyde dehydrogenase family protein [Spirosomataceae bacterium]